MMNEKMDWNKKMNEWINGLLEINEFLENRKETLISRDEKLMLWESFKRIIDEVNMDFMEMWKDGEYDKIDMISNLLDVTFDKLEKFVNI